LFDLAEHFPQHPGLEQPLRRPMLTASRLPARHFVRERVLRRFVRVPVLPQMSERLLPALERPHWTEPQRLSPSKPERPACRHSPGRPQQAMPAVR
jgi:hypothetical protein